MALFIPISKVDVAQRRVYGTISEEVRDKSDEILDYASAKPAFEKWSNEIKEASGGKSLGNVRAMHGSIAAGKFTDINYDDDAKRIEGCAKIIDDNEWNKVVEGVYTGFSIGGGYARRWPDPNNSGVMRYTPILAEVSIVDNPCVSTATFEYIKADGSREMRKFTPSHKEDSMDPKALADAREALAKGTATDEQKALIATADAELLKAAQDAEAKGTATDEQKVLLAKVAADAAPALVKDGKPVKPKAAPVQKNVWLASDETEHASKREAEIHNLHLEKQAELAPGLAQMDALLKAAKKPAEDDDDDKEGDDEETKKAKEKAEKDDAEMAAKAKKEKEDEEGADKAAADALGKKDYSDKERKEMAESGEAMEDGNFPIKNKKDLENAIQAYGRAKDKDKAKAHIKARAKALGAEDTLPDDWKGGKKKGKSAPAAGLRKGLHQVGWFAHMLSELTCFQDSVEMEQYFEGDKDSELPAKLKSLVSEMCELLVTLVEEETQELVEDNEDTDVEVMEMAAGLPSGHAAALGKLVAAMRPYDEAELQKPEVRKAVETFIVLNDALTKAGARHSKADKENLMAIHKSACDHVDSIEKCFKDMGVMPDDADDRDAKKMSKLLDLLQSERDQNSAITKVLTGTNESLQKAVPLIESLQKANAELVARMEHLEKQPAAPKGHVRTISKTQDSGGANGETEAEYKERLAKMNPAEKSRELMKLAMSNPMEMPAL